MTGFSIVVPAFQEAINIPYLAERIAMMNFTQPFEVLIMDDNSNDGTFNIVEKLSQQYPWLKLIVLSGQRDLSLAVIQGFHHAKYSNVITMDADLSHPPEKIPKLLELLAMPHVDVVLGSRYVKGGSVDQSWHWLRKFISRLCALSARMLVDAHDPLTGFLAINKDKVLNAPPLKPIGWKIGLEIMVKCNCKNILEVPIHFSNRKHGKSKLNFKQARNYFYHLVVLIVYKFTRQA